MYQPQPEPDAMADELAALLAQLKEPDQPQTLFKIIDRATKALVGHRLFTILLVDGDQVERLHSNRPDEEPVGGRKPMGSTPWGELVLKRREPFLGTDMEAIRWAFSNHESIKAKGMGSVINIPIVYDAETIGTMNLLDAEHHYKPDDVSKVHCLASLLIPAMMAVRRNGHCSQRGW
jgi:transcriptional regulator with GAF, ATPase, and Fis domain